MDMHYAFDRVGKIFRLQVGELALLVPQFNVKQVVVDLGYQSLQRNSSLYTSRGHDGCRDISWIYETIGSGWLGNPSLLEVTRGMPGRRHLFDALPKQPPTTDNVRDLRLINGDFNGTWPDVICGGMDIMKIGVHSVLSLALRPWLRFIKSGVLAGTYRRELCARVVDILPSSASLAWFSTPARSNCVFT